MAKNNKAKNKLIAGLAITAVGGLSVAGIVTGIQNAQAKPDYTTTTQEVIDENTQLKADLNTTQENLAELQAQKTALEAQLATANSDKTTLQAQLATVNAQIETLQGEIETLEAQLQAYTGATTIADLLENHQVDFQKIGNNLFMRTVNEYYSDENGLHYNKLYKLNADGYSISEIQGVKLIGNWITTEDIDGNFNFFVCHCDWDQGLFTHFLVHKTTGDVIVLADVENSNEVAYRFDGTNFLYFHRDRGLIKISNSGTVTEVEMPENVNLDILRESSENYFFYEYTVENDEIIPNLTTLHVYNIADEEWSTINIDDALDFNFDSVEYDERSMIFAFSTNGTTRYFTFDPENIEFIEIRQKTVNLTYTLDENQVQTTVTHLETVWLGETIGRYFEQLGLGWVDAGDVTFYITNTDAEPENVSIYLTVNDDLNEYYSSNYNWNVEITRTFETPVVEWHQRVRIVRLANDDTIIGSVTGPSTYVDETWTFQSVTEFLADTYSSSVSGYEVEEIRVYEGRPNTSELTDYSTNKLNSTLTYQTVQDSDLLTDYVSMGDNLIIVIYREVRGQGWE